MNAASAPLPEDSAIMRAWNEFKQSESYKNSYFWATCYVPDDDPAELERVYAKGVNPFTKEMKIKAVEGSLWNLFMHGWLAKGDSI